jgi:acetoacetate decarboxylase
MIGQCYAPPPYHYSKAEEVIVVFETDPEAIAPMLPQPLKVEDRTFGSVRVMRHALGVFGPYSGVYLGVTARFRDQQVVHILTGVKTEFAGIAAGRELWGLPLQLGSVEMSWCGELLKVDVGRSSDTPLARILLQLTDRLKPAVSDLLSTTSAAVPTFEDPGREHVLVGLRTEHTYEGAELWGAEASLELYRGSQRDDWSSVPIRRVVRATYMAGGKSVLHAGRVLAKWEEES